MTMPSQLAAGEELDLSQVFVPECVETIPRNTHKGDALRTLISSLARAGRISHDKVASITDALVERERLGTTGMGKGLALPHMRTRDVNQFVGALGIAPDGIEFESLDGLPTTLIILLLSPYDERQTHSAMMAKLARFMTDNTLQYSLRAPRSPESLLRFLGFA